MFKSQSGVLPSRIQVALLALLLVAVLLAPFFVGPSNLIIGNLSMAAAVGAIGLTLLVGTAGQLSLAHAFFVALGAYGYGFFAGDPSNAALPGMGWPPLLAAFGGMAVAGLAGLAFSPVAARVRGLYLGVASLGLIFIGQHVFRNASSITGGSNGRTIPPFVVGGVELNGRNPGVEVLGVAFGPQERLWYLLLVILVFTAFFAWGIVNSRPGRALTMVRDNEAAASALGINVQHYKAAIFVLSSAMAGGSGVLTALVFSYIVPEYFNLLLSINFLAMVIIGGMGSIGGAVVGATVVTALPLLLDRVAQNSDLLAPAGSGGYDASTVAGVIFGALIVAIIIGRGGSTRVTKKFSVWVNKLRTDKGSAKQSKESGGNTEAGRL